MGVAKAKRQRVRAEMLSTLSFSMSKTKSHIRHPDTLLLQCKRKGGMAYARKHILDMAMGNEIERLHEKLRTLQSENRSLQEENEKLQRALSRKKGSIIRSL